MMKIFIQYDSSWRNSFLSGELGESDRKFIGSSKSLGEDGNYKEKNISKNTVMGILSRLIGDPRCLHQARNKKYGPYYFEDIEEKINFIDSPIYSEEIVYLRNMNKNTSPTGYSGIMKSDGPVFTSDCSDEFWGVLQFNLIDLCKFILDDAIRAPNMPKNLMNPLDINEKMESLKNEKIKNVDDELLELVNNALIYLKTYFESGTFNKVEKINDIKELNKHKVTLYCSALYIQLDRLHNRGFDISGLKTSRGGIKGFSKISCTSKDFLGGYATGGGRLVFGSPYIKKEIIKGAGEVVSMLNKASGTLVINLDIDKERSNELNTMIDNAGLSAFYVGKKGLAYVEKIS